MVQAQAQVSQATIKAQAIHNHPTTIRVQVVHNHLAVVKVQVAISHRLHQTTTRNLPATIKAQTINHHQTTSQTVATIKVLHQLQDKIHRTISHHQTAINRQAIIKDLNHLTAHKLQPMKVQDQKLLQRRLKLHQPPALLDHQLDKMESVNVKVSWVMNQTVPNFIDVSTMIREVINGMSSIVEKERYGMHQLKAVIIHGQCLTKNVAKHQHQVHKRLQIQGNRLQANPLHHVQLKHNRQQLQPDQ